jgi:hypothetical protein
LDTPAPLALFRADPVGVEPAADLTALAARIHALRGDRRLSYRPQAFSFDGAPMASGLRIGLVDAKGDDAWLSTVAGAGLTEPALRAALRLTAPTAFGAAS